MENPLLKLAQSMMKKDRWSDTINLLMDNFSTVEEQWELLWNLGWCHFKLHQLTRAQKYLTAASVLAPQNYACKYGLGQVYLKKRQYKKAEMTLSEALQLRESHAARIGLALAYLAPGKREEAEKMRLRGIRLTPKRSEVYESYAAFLSDVGREAEAEEMNHKARELQRIH